MTLTVLPAPGDKPVVQPLDFEGKEFAYVSCWCGDQKLVGGAATLAITLSAASRIADEHYVTHRWVNRWPSLARFMIKP